MQEIDKRRYSVPTNPPEYPPHKHRTVIWNKTQNRIILTNSLNGRSNERTASPTKRQPLSRLLSLLKKSFAAEMTHIPSPNLCQPSWGGKHFQIWRNYERSIEGNISFGLFFNLECHTLGAGDARQSQFWGACLSLGIIIIMTVVSLSQWSLLLVRL